MIGPARRSRVWLVGLLLLPIGAAFLFTGAQVSLAIGAATAAAIVVVAARAGPEGPIEVAAPESGASGGLLVVALSTIEDPRTAGVIAAMADPAREAGAGGMLLLAPARGKLLDRWADDLERARFESQRVLAVSVATLAAAGVAAEGRVGDGDPRQAVEDALRTYAATEVIVVAGSGVATDAIAKLERRLTIPLRRVEPG